MMTFDTDPGTKAELTNRIQRATDFRSLGCEGDIVVKRVKDNAFELFFPQTQKTYVVTISKPLPPNSRRSKIVGDRMRNIMALAKKAREAEKAATSHPEATQKVSQPPIQMDHEKRTVEVQDMRQRKNNKKTNDYSAQISNTIPW